MLKDLHIFGYFAVFFPGSFYEDRRGVQFADLAFQELDRTDRTGFANEFNSGLDNDTAYHINMGIEYRF